MALKLEGLGTNGATHVASLETILEECLGVTVTIAADGTVTRGERDGATPEGQQTVTELFDEIVNYTRNNRPVTLKILVGRSQTDVVLDLFRRREIDVGDLAAFPTSAPADSPNRTTRCEMLAHILAEYLHAMEKGHLTGPQRFNQAHREGLRAQTRHRRRNGQAGDSKANEKSPDGTVFRCQYTGGVHADAVLEDNNITGFR